MSIIGSQKLLREMLLQVADGTAILPAGSATEIFVETFDASQFSFYFHDVVPTDPSILADVFETTGSVAGAATVAAGVNCAILKRRTAGPPDTIDVILFLTSVIDMLPVKYRVYRVAGLS